MSRAMQDCDRFREQLVDLIEGELVGEEHRQITVHLSLCPQCSREAHALQETLARLRALPEPPVPAGFLDGFAADVRRRIATEARLHQPFWQRAAAWLGGLSSLRPVPALSVAAALGLLLAIGLLHTPRLTPLAPAPEIVVVGESLSIAQNLDVLEHFDLLEEMDLLEQLPLLRSRENGRPPRLS